MKSQTIAFKPGSNKCVTTITLISLPLQISTVSHNRIWYALWVKPRWGRKCVSVSTHACKWVGRGVRWCVRGGQWDGKTQKTKRVRGVPSWRPLISFWIVEKRQQRQRQTNWQKRREGEKEGWSKGLQPYWWGLWLGGRCLHPVCSHHCQFSSDRHDTASVCLTLQQCPRKRKGNTTLIMCYFLVCAQISVIGGQLVYTNPLIKVLHCFQLVLNLQYQMYLFTCFPYLWTLRYPWE